MNNRKTFLFTLLVLTLCVTSVCFAEEFQLGTRTETSYVNEGAGIRIDLNDQYVMTSDEEINQLMQIGIDASENPDLGQQVMDIASITTLYEMLAMNPADGSSLQVTAEKPLVSAITLDQYCTALLNSTRNMYSISDVEQGETTLCGREWATVRYALTVSGFTMTQEFYITKYGDRFFAIAFSGLFDSSFETMSGFLSCTNAD